MPEPSLPPPSWPSGTSGSSPASPDGSPPPPAPTSSRSRPGDGSAPPPPPPGDASEPASSPWTTPDHDWAGPPAEPPPPSAPDRGSSGRGQRTLVVALAAVVVLVLAGVAVVQLFPGPADTQTAGSEPGATRAPSESGRSTAPLGDGELSPEVARAHRELLAAIDASEQEMLALSATTPLSSEELDEEGLSAFEEAADDHVAELERIDEQLAALDTAGSDEVAAIRDDYRTHLGDWIDWGGAVASDPTLVDRPEASGPYFDAINDSADGFATSVERNLDRDAAPDDVVDLADEIIRRGFSTGEDDGTEI